MVIDADRLAARKEAVQVASANTAGQRRKSAVADKFDAFLRAHTAGSRGWESATDADVHDWLCWLDSHGNGTKVVHAVDCVAIGSNSLDSCSAGSTCAKRYAAQTLDKGFVTKLKRVMVEILGKSDPWDEREKRGNAADSAAVRRYLSYAQIEQRRAGVTVKQARPMLAPLLLRLVRYIHA